MASEKQRYIVWMPAAPAWELPPARHGACTGGGHRVLHELAVAVAATGRRVEVRGEFDFEELSALCEAAGAALEFPTEPHKPAPGDIVMMPEGLHDPLSFGLIALSPARRILLLLGPPGVAGWPFADGWSLRPAVDIGLEDVARPEHFRAMHAMGFELWANAPALVKRIEDAGIRGTFIGVGRPAPFPDPPPKRYDVVTLAHNRWSELAARVVEQLDPSVLHYEIPASTHGEVLRRFGEARVLIHPLRIEGDSRIGQEARAMGAVPVVLNSNPFSVGLDEHGGAVPVGSLEEMPHAVMSLLADPQRLEQLRERGISAVRTQFAWEPYVERVDAALRQEPNDDPAAAARAVIGNALEDREHELIAALRAETANVAAAKARVESERDAVAGELDQARATIQAMQNTRVWRAAGAFWRTRDRLRRMIKS